MDYLKHGWSIVQQDLVGWIIVCVVFGLITSFTFGLGIVLLPNLVRATRVANKTGEAPALDALFKFDDIVDDAIVVVGQQVANAAGSLACGIGALVTTPLFLFAPHVLAEGQYDGINSLKAAMEYGKSDIVGILVPLLVMSILISLAVTVTCGLAGLVAGPVFLVALEQFYQDVRNDLLGAAQRAQIPTKA